MKRQPTTCSGPFTSSWTSLSNYSPPAWYEDAKFGIFIHWGVYAVPAFGNEWYPRSMYLKGTEVFNHHIKTYGPQHRFGYKDFIPMFTAQKFDPAAWAATFRRAGARFVVPVAEHHDGFPMYETALCRWNAARMGPRRDVIGELAKAVRDEGMNFGVSSHRAEHWWFFCGGQTFDSDVRRGKQADLYGPAAFLPDTEEGRNDRKSLPMPDKTFLDDWLARCCELTDNYQPDLFYFDWWIQHIAFDSYLQKFAAYFYNRAARRRGHGVINYKTDAFPVGAGTFDIERGHLKGIRRPFWQTDTAVAKNSWCNISTPDYKTAASIVHDLIDVVSKNGALLLNVGPRADGTLAEPEVKMLDEIGDWLRLNGEAIYGARPWTTFGEGPTEVIEGTFNDVKRAPFTPKDFRFTRKGSVLYAIALGWPRNRELAIQSLGRNSTFAPVKIRKAELLGYTGSLNWKQTTEALTIQLPKKQPCRHAFVFKIV